MNRFKEYFGQEPEFKAAAPGRTELGGNHTDHQHGLVLAAPVNLQATAYFRANKTECIRIISEGYEPFQVSLKDTKVREEEFGTPAALVRGVAAAFIEHGLTGFDAYITSDIPSGSGLSSSAAMEILLGRICCRLTGNHKSGQELAILGQSVENRYFGKPCGLMDQMACASQGILAIDFYDTQNPVAEQLSYDFAAAGYELCIIQCGAGHEDLTADYASIPQELHSVCRVFGKDVLREIDEEEFWGNISQVRRKCGDRAVLRAIHVYDENRRVREQIKALKENCIDAYLELVAESGDSSWKLLQNVIAQGSSCHQEMAFALALAKRALEGEGAARVHGGGFAGTIQAYVPIERRDNFRSRMEADLGKGSCLFVSAG